MRILDTFFECKVCFVEGYANENKNKNKITTPCYKHYMNFAEFYSIQNELLLQFYLYRILFIY
jgi:hypothetical protein